jgi:hypothetical protein
MAGNKPPAFFFSRSAGEREERIMAQENDEGLRALEALDRETEVWVEEAATKIVSWLERGVDVSFLRGVLQQLDEAVEAKLERGQA